MKLQVEFDELAALPPGHRLMVMCSTCGEGDVPKNAKEFVAGLEKENYTRFECISSHLSRSFRV